MPFQIISSDSAILLVSPSRTGAADRAGAELNTAATRTAWHRGPITGLVPSQGDQTLEGPLGVIKIHLLSQALLGLGNRYAFEEHSAPDFQHHEPNLQVLIRGLKQVVEFAIG